MSIDNEGDGGKMRTICGTFLAAAVALAAVGAEGGARVELPLDGGWSGSVSGDDW